MAARHTVRRATFSHYRLERIRIREQLTLEDSSDSHDTGSAAWRIGAEGQRSLGRAALRRNAQNDLRRGAEAGDQDRSDGGATGQGFPRRRNETEEKSERPESQ